MLRTALRWLAPPLIVVGLALGVVGFQRVAIDARLKARNAEMRAELMRVRARNDQLRGQLARLRAESRRLRHEPEESLHHARTELGLVHSDEVVYRFAPKQPGGAETP